MEPSKSISVKKEWLEKARQQALSTRKEDYAVAISFGENKEYYIIEDTFMEELYKSREALRGVEDLIHSYIDITGDDILEVIEEVFK